MIDQVKKMCTPVRGARRWRRPLLAFALLVATVGLAQEPAATAPDVDRYDIEIIVFRHLGADSSGTVTAEPAASTAAEGSASGATWTPLGPAALRLGGTAARLRRPGVYQLLYHGGWSQAVTSRTRALPVPMPPEARANGVAGTVTVYRERYLHALLDLGLATGSAGEATARMRSGRRLKGQALQYFDDPRFGVILAVRPAATSAVPASNP
jgi:hypothetical protein